MTDAEVTGWVRGPDRHWTTERPASLLLRQRVERKGNPAAAPSSAGAVGGARDEGEEEEGDDDDEHGDGHANEGGRKDGGGGGDGEGGALEGGNAGGGGGGARDACGREGDGQEEDGSDVELPDASPARDVDGESGGGSGSGSGSGSGPLEELAKGRADSDPVVASAGGAGGAGPDSMDVDEEDEEGEDDEQEEEHPESDTEEVMRERGVDHLFSTAYNFMTPRRIQAQKLAPFALGDGTARRELLALRSCVLVEQDPGDEPRKGPERHKWSKWFKWSTKAGRSKGIVSLNLCNVGTKLTVSYCTNK